MITKLRAFAVSTKFDRDEETIINHISHNKAKSKAFFGMPDGYKYTDIRCRVVGKPHTSIEFIRNAIYRGIPDVRCGDIAETANGKGWVVGCNSSANLDVLFFTGKHQGLTLNVHPLGILKFDKA